MVAKTPPKQRKIMVASPLSPTLLRETVKKVDQCMARLQELQYTVTGGNKVVAGVKLSPRSTKSYLKTSLRCKQESIRIRNNASKKSPVGKLPASVIGEWRRMSLSTMLVGETVAEILQASKITRDFMGNAKIEDPKTPLPRKQKPSSEKTPIETRRKREKQHQFRIIRAESGTPSSRKARSKINFKVSPDKRSEIVREKNGSNGSIRYTTNRVSPKHKPWVKKTVLFPNPVFHSSPNSKPNQFRKKNCESNPKRIETPHKFLVKSPVKIKSPHKGLNSVSPVSKTTILSRKSPPKMGNSSMASKLRRSLSPSRLANRLVSPLKGRRISLNGGSFDGGVMKQRTPALMMMPLRFSSTRTSNIGIQD
ncbi:probable microtubule-binding protein TANGLED [Amaranthus tricolor]|uniref:probable microtubule-binding protein TANGLED n=1 Tax=Amaranthus tricolor TaxID=29722 RepID=UPI00258CFA00|nr:probable microtubule-binding protein TANGLED [Amaranthus tricolor]